MEPPINNSSNKYWKMLRDWLGFLLLVVSFLFLLMGSMGSRWIYGGVILVWAIVYAIWFLGEGAKKSWTHFCWTIFLAFASSVIGNLTVFYIESIHGQQNYKILLIGEKSQPQWDSFIRGYRRGLTTLSEKQKAAELIYDGDTIGTLYIQGNGNERISVKIVEVGLPEDGNEDQNREEIKKEISNIVTTDKTAQMLIGFVTSTKADLALQAIEEAKGYDWPCIILPMATASDLVKSHNSRQDKPILRLVPPNYLQAHLMAQKIVDLKTNNDDVKVAIFRDSSNYKYSTDLAIALRGEIESNNAAVIFDGSIGPNSSGQYITESFATLRPDCIVFLGMLNTGIPLVRQIKAMVKLESATGKPQWNPVILLSDGSVDKEIEGYAQKDELKNVYGFFPHGFPDMKNSPIDSSDDPSFTMFGYDSAIFSHEIFQAAISKNTKLNRKNLAEALRSVRIEWGNGNDPPPEEVLVGAYKFDNYGDASGVGYHIWLFDGSTWICDEKNLNR